MKKLFAALLVIAILCFSACGKSPDYPPKDGSGEVTIKTDKSSYPLDIDVIGVTVTNNSKKYITYSTDEFYVDQYIDGEWTRIFKNVIDNLMTIKIEPNESKGVRYEFGFSSRFEKLEAGKYRFKVPLRVEGTVLSYYAEFNLEASDEG